MGSWNEPVRLGDTWLHQDGDGGRLEVTRKTGVVEVVLRGRGLVAFRRQLPPEEGNEDAAAILGGWRPELEVHRPDPADPLGDYEVVGGRWLWRGAAWRKGPLAEVGGAVRYVRPLLFERHRGHRLRGDFARVRCGDDRCCSPGHLD